MEVGKIREIQNPRKQLLLLVRARTKKGKTLTLRTLVDTGAEANLIRKNLLPPPHVKVHQPPILGHRGWYTYGGGHEGGFPQTHFHG